jgi:hypothetical protein
MLLGMLFALFNKSKDFEVLLRLLVLFCCAFVKCPGSAFFSVSGVLAVLLFCLSLLIVLVLFA